MKVSIRILFLVALIVFTGCGKGGDATPDADAMVEADHIEVQHLLVSFQGAINKPGVIRSQEEAEALANELFGRAQTGVDFDSLVEEYTDDQHPGIYAMHNFDVEPLQGIQESSRARMVKSFGDVGFSLKVGEIGMAVFDSTDSRYGWHIVKRLK